MNRQHLKKEPWWLLLVLFPFFWGCAVKVQPLLPLSDSQQVAAENLLQKYLAQPLPAAVDADIHLSWDIFGSKGNIDGILQLQRPASIRLTLLDPLGRTLLILVADSKRFTIIDSRTATAFTGTEASEAWLQYVPSLIAVEDLFSLLGGLLSDRKDLVYTGSGSVEETGDVWYLFQDKVVGKKQRVLLDQSGRCIRRRILIDEDQRPAVDIVYSSYLTVPDSTRLWPGQVAITGESVRGQFTLKVRQVVSVAPLPASTFFLSIPHHFSVKHLP